MLKFQVLGQGFRLCCFQVTGLEVGVEAPYKEALDNITTQKRRDGGLPGGVLSIQKNNGDYALILSK